MGERKRDPLIFTQDRVKFPLLRKELKEKTVGQQKADVVPRRRRGRGGRPGGWGARRGAGFGPGAARAHSTPAASRRAAARLRRAARAAVRPPGSERSLPRPSPAPSLRPIMPPKIIDRGLEAAAPGPVTPSRPPSIPGHNGNAAGD